MTRKPDLPCSSCGKLMWRSWSTAAEPKCRTCRRAEGHWYRERTLGTCSECARDAVAKDLCATHYARKWRSDAGGPVPWIPVQVRLAVYERDSVCQICQGDIDWGADRKTADLAPSLDHVTPKSWQVVPDHSTENLRLAHRICNARRGNRADVSS